MSHFHPSKNLRVTFAASAGLTMIPHPQHTEPTVLPLCLPPRQWSGPWAGGLCLAVTLPPPVPSHCPSWMSRTSPRFKVSPPESFLVLVSFWVAEPMTCSFRSWEGQRRRCLPEALLSETHTWIFQLSQAGLILITLKQESKLLTVMTAIVRCRWTSVGDFTHTDSFNPFGYLMD